MLFVADESCMTGWTDGKKSVEVTLRLKLRQKNIIVLYCSITEETYLSKQYV